MKSVDTFIIWNVFHTFDTWMKSADTFKYRKSIQKISGKILEDFAKYFGNFREVFRKILWNCKNYLRKFWKLSYFGKSRKWFRKVLKIFVMYREILPNVLRNYFKIFKRNFKKFREILRRISRNISETI